MTLLQALVLGIVQGLTEFIPVSSSAHLVLVPWLLNWSIDPQASFAFDVLVQLGTLAAVIVVFWRDGLDILREALSALLNRRWAEGRLAWLLLLATLPAAAAGIVLKDPVERAFASPAASSAFLLGTAALLGLSEVLRRRGEGGPARDPTPSGAEDSAELLRPGDGAPDFGRARTGTGDPLEELGSTDSLLIGLAQALALFPGISRSGSTIAAGLARGLTRPQAARFSFLMAVPIMLGAGLVAGTDLASLAEAGQQLPALGVGFLAAAVVGVLAIRWLLRFLTHSALWVFAAYCALAGLAGLTLSLARAMRAEAEVPSPLPRIAVTPALEAWVAQSVLAFRAARPAGDYAALGFTVETLPLADAQQAAERGEVVLLIAGSDPPEGWFATPLGRLAIAVVVHPDNPVRQLSLTELRDLLAGRIQSWEALGEFARPVQPVIPPEGDELRLAVQRAALEGGRFTSASLLAPSAPAMAELVAGEPGAVGLLPLTELSEDLPAVRIEGELPAQVGAGYPLWIAIVAAAPQEPEGVVREWLGWLQSVAVSSGPAGTDCCAAPRLR
jgi:undecaprenyl-diphosphatase